MTDDTVCSKAPCDDSTGYNRVVENKGDGGCVEVSRQTTPISKYSVHACDPLLYRTTF